MTRRIQIATAGSAHNSDYGAVILSRSVPVLKIVLTGIPGPRPETPVVSYVPGGSERSVLRPRRSVLRMSPRTGPRRPTVTFRLAEDAIAFIAARAAEEGIQRSEMIRKMLTYAARHMPKGWKP